MKPPERRTHAPPAPSPRALAVWGRWTDALAWWFRYTCEGDEHIPSDRSSLIAGYHGRPAYDMFMLMARLYRRDGRFPYGIGHRVFFDLPGVRQICESVALYDGSPQATAALVARGEPIAVLPGGARECYRSSRIRYRVDWGPHRGYLRLALRHRIPIVPVASSGVDEFYFILGDGYQNSKRWFGTDAIPVCLPLGIAGVPFPIGVPHRVRVRQRVGEAIEPEALEALRERGETNESRRFLDRAHRTVTGTLQKLLDRARESA